MKLDPSKSLLRTFIDLNNRVLDRLGGRAPAPRRLSGGDRDSTHSADVDYAELLPSLNVGNFYVQLASERRPVRVLQTIKEVLRPAQRVFVGVIDVLDPAVELPELVRDRVLQAARYIPIEQLGTTDDCGFSPFADDSSTSVTLPSPRYAQGSLARKWPPMR